MSARGCDVAVTLLVALVLAGACGRGPAAPDVPLAGVSWTQRFTDCGVRGPYCVGNGSTRCLASSGNGLQWVDRALWPGARPNPHFLLPHLRRIRNAAERDTRCARLLDETLGSLAETLRSRRGALVWENVEGRAQCMEQSEMATLFATSAEVLDRGNRTSAARRARRVALGLREALSLPAHPRSGGCSSALDEDGCVGCRWYHSRGLGILERQSGPPWVLNQHLHAIDESLQFASAWRRQVNDAGDREIEVHRSLELARAGLRALQHEHVGVHRWLYRPFQTSEHVWVFYALDPITLDGRNISRPRTCHYSDHVLKKVDDIEATVRELRDDSLLELVRGIQDTLIPLRQSAGTSSLRERMGCLHSESQESFVRIHRASEAP